MHPKKVLSKDAVETLTLYLNKSLGIDVKLVHPLKVKLNEEFVTFVL